MASLYNIDQRILDCIDYETGEILDAEALDALYIERDQKIENVALYIKNLESDAKAYAAEEIAFKQRKQAAQKTAARLREWLATALNGQKFSTSKCAISFIKSTRLVIAEGAEIPPQLIKASVTYTPDANAIKALLKEGTEISGCRLVECLNTQLK